MTIVWQDAFGGSWVQAAMVAPFAGCLSWLLSVLQDAFGSFHIGRSILFSCFRKNFGMGYLFVCMLL